MVNSDDREDFAVVVSDLQNPDPVIRLRAIATMVRTGDEHSAEHLRRISENDSEALIRSLAAQGADLLKAASPAAGTVIGVVPTVKEFSMALHEAERKMAPSSIRKAMSKTGEPPRKSLLTVAVEDLASYQGSEHGSDTLIEPAEADGPESGPAKAQGLGSKAQGPGSQSRGPGMQPGNEGKYLVAGEVGHGGMGVILNAFDTDIKRDVAMKVITSGWHDSREYTERFIKEAQVQGQLEHPNICPVHELGVHSDGRIYFTMKMVKGYSLAQMIKQDRDNKKSQNPKRLTEILNVFLKICDGMAFAHSRDIIHRDLKPDNIMVGDFGEVYVMDWGLAKIVGIEDDDCQSGLVIDNRGGESDTMKTITGSVVGTPAYMPPEQAAGLVEKMDQRSDIYSLGALLYELLALEPPYPEKNAWEVLSKIQNEMPPPPSSIELTKAISPELDSIVMKCLEKDRVKRYQTVQELKHEIELFLSGRPIGAMNYSPWQVFAKWVSRNKVLSTAFAAVLLVIVSAATIAYLNMSRSWKNEQQARLRAEENTRVAINALSETERQKGIADEQRTRAEEQRKVAEERQKEAELSALKSRLNLAMTREEKREIGEAVSLYKEIKQDMITKRLPAFPFIDLAIWRAEYNQGQVIRNLATLKGSNASFRCVTFSPDSRLLAVGCDNSTIQLWEQATGKKIHEIKGSPLSVFSLAFSPDGTYLAAGYGDATLRIWRCADWKQYASLNDTSLEKSWKAHTQGIEDLDFSPDSTHLVSVADEIVKLWNIKEKKLVRKFWGHLRSAQSVDFSPDGTQLISSGKDHSIHLWNVETGTLERILYKHIDRVKGVAYSPDGNLVASAGDDTVVKIWSVKEDREVATLQGHETTVETIAFSPDGKILATGGQDFMVRFWDVERKVELATFKDHRGTVISLAFSPDGKRMASAGRDKMVKIWSLERESMVKTMDFSDNSYQIECLDFSPDGKQLAAGPWSAKLVPMLMIDCEKAAVTNQFLLHGGKVSSVKFSPDGSLVVTGADDSVMRIANAASGETLGMINVVEETITDSLSVLMTTMQVLTKKPKEIWDCVSEVAFTPDGRHIATVCDDGKTKLWDVAAQRRIHVFHETGHEMESVDFSPDGSLLATAGRSAEIRVWNVDDRTSAAELTGHQGSIWSVRFSPDGRLLASGSSDKSIRLWDVETWRCISVLQGAYECVNTLAFTPDSRILAAGDDGTTVNLWDVANEECLLSLKEHVNDVTSVAFSPDGTVLATGSLDYTIKFWYFGNALKPLTFNEEPVQ